MTKLSIIVCSAFLSGLGISQPQPGHMPVHPQYQSGYAPSAHQQSGYAPSAYQQSGYDNPAHQQSRYAYPAHQEYEYATPIHRESRYAPSKHPSRYASAPGYGVHRGYGHGNQYQYVNVANSGYGYGRQAYNPSASFYALNGQVNGNGAHVTKKTTIGTLSNVHVDDNTQTYNDNHTKLNKTTDKWEETNEKYNNANKYAHAKYIHKGNGPNQHYGGYRSGGYSTPTPPIVYPSTSS